MYLEFYFFQTDDWHDRQVNYLFFSFPESYGMQCALKYELALYRKYIFQKYFRM